MSYVKPAEFVKQMVDAGEAKTFLSTRDTLIRAYMAGAILALAAAFAVTLTVHHLHHALLLACGAQQSHTPATTIRCPHSRRISLAISPADVHASRRSWAVATC